MTLLTPADFRATSLNEACQGLALADEAAPDPKLAATISRLTSRLNRWCNDRFEPTTGALTIDGHGTGRLVLPYRYTAVTQVKTVDQWGTASSALDATAYRLHSSLNATGDDRIDQEAVLDWLELVYGGAGLTAPMYGDAYCWPDAALSVQVTGTYGWTTCPPEVKRALAIMVWDHYTRIRGDARAAEEIRTDTTLVRFQSPDPAKGIFTGFPECDGVIGDFRRVLTVGAR